MLAQVFGTSFEFFTAPPFVQYALLLITRKYGTDLDVRAPKFARVRAFRLLRKYGIPGTPLS
jgi:hypothetical protein